MTGEDHIGDPGGSRGSGNRADIGSALTGTS